MEKLKLFEEFLGEDEHIKDHTAWDKHLTIGLGDDEEGGFVDVSVNGVSVGRVYIIQPDELVTYKNDLETKEDPNKELPSVEDSTPPAEPTEPQGDEE